MTQLESSRKFWNEKAKENPLWYVSSFGSYSNRDTEAFWRSGFTIWNELKSWIGFRALPSQVVVEIGCGVGRLTRAIVEDVGHCIAFDISENMLQIAREKLGPRATFHVTTGTSLAPLSAETSDLTVAYCVFQHLPDEAAMKSYLAEMVRVTKPGGTIAFTTSPRSWRARLLPLARTKAFLRERMLAESPRGLHRREWVGIRPSRARVQSLSPVQLQSVPFGAERVLFWGRV